MMEKNSETCKKSICFQGIYLCRLELLPCGMIEKCAMEKVDDMVKAASDYIHGRITKQNAKGRLDGELHGTDKEG